MGKQRVFRGHKVLNIGKILRVKLRVDPLQGVFGPKGTIGIGKFFKS